MSMPPPTEHTNPSVTSFGSRAPLVDSHETERPTVKLNRRSRSAIATRTAVCLVADIVHGPSAGRKAIKRTVRNGLVKADLMTRPDSSDSDNDDDEPPSDPFDKWPRTVRLELWLAKYWTEMRATCGELLEVTPSLEGSRDADRQRLLIDRFDELSADWRLKTNGPTSLGDGPGTRTQAQSIQAYCQAVLSEQGVQSGPELQTAAEKLFKEAETKFRTSTTGSVSVSADFARAGTTPDEIYEEKRHNDDDGNIEESLGREDQYSEKRSFNGESVTSRGTGGPQSERAIGQEEG